MTLDATQRCDRCGAQAVVLVSSLDWPADLLFCAHHFAKHYAKLATLDGVVVVDDRVGVTP